MIRFVGAKKSISIFFILRVKNEILKCLTPFTKNEYNTIYFINEIAYVPIGPSLVLRGNPRR
jgi:hypothetical protein